MKVVRWIGAFAKRGTLAESLSYEFSRPATDEVCAERYCGRSVIEHARVGLLVKRTAVVKRFTGDCYSVADETGRLHKTRNPRHAGSHHTEVWCNPVYVAVVLDEFNAPAGLLSRKTYAEIYGFAAKNKIKVLVIDQYGNWEDRTP